MNEPEFIKQLASPLASVYNGTNYKIIICHQTMCLIGKISMDKFAF